MPMFFWSPDNGASSPMRTVPPALGARRQPLSAAPHTGDAKPDQQRSPRSRPHDSPSPAARQPDARPSDVTDSRTGEQRGCLGRGCLAHVEAVPVGVDEREHQRHVGPVEEVAHVEAGRRDRCARRSGVVGRQTDPGIDPGGEFGSGPDQCDRGLPPDRSISIQRKPGRSSVSIETVKPSCWSTDLVRSWSVTGTATLLTFVNTFVVME